MTMVKLKIYSLELKINLATYGAFTVNLTRLHMILRLEITDNSLTFIPNMYEIGFFFFLRLAGILDTHNFTLQQRRVIRVIHYNPTLQHNSALEFLPKEFTAISDDPHHPDTFAQQ